ncbi:XPA protein C-terminus-domain-containing protein [Mortierella sp. GBAus27b]|nr:hypothetical protein BGX31_000399 [Mortierella sp. GBA43]KAI8360536.1 XPA protein C-terminus-domain-containing protein [Mortierella sp. GBAus27b]
MTDQGTADSAKATETATATTTTSTSSTSSTSAPSAGTGSDANVPHEGTVGRPVSRKEFPPEVQARIEKNRLAAMERQAKRLKNLESEQAITKAMDDFMDKNAQLIHKAVAETEPLPKNEWTRFYDYDLSNMKDTRAGFIQDLDDKDKIGSGSNANAAIFFGADDNYECQDCTSVDIDFQLLRYFHVPICVGCRDTQPEKYSLLTKTECRADYLLTDPELRDTELFPCWERPNPKKATWNNMLLYLRCQVEEYAFKKWGGPEGLDQEFERRERDKQTRKEAKFKKELRDLRNKTRTSIWQDKKMKQRPKPHQHHFGTALVDPESGASVQTCIECGIQVECEEF